VSTCSGTRSFPTSLYFANRSSLTPRRKGDILLSMKTCTKCGTLRDFSDFTRNVRQYTKDGYRNRCKLCEKLSPEKQSWKSMLSRTRNPNHKKFEHYGGRGIVVCTRWCKFENFLEDILSTIGPRPKGKSLDRVDNNRNYELYHPVTGALQVKWSTRAEQAANRRPRSK
jgi:hypothetical protein